MTFHSILSDSLSEATSRETPVAPDFFVDLNLDQVIDAITLGQQDYNLKPFFYAPLHESDAIAYRQEIFHDLENPVLFGHIQAFAQTMRLMRGQLAQANKLYYAGQKKAWFLDAVETYSDAIQQLMVDLSQVDCQSRGFLSFRAYVSEYASSERFTSLLAETKNLKADLAGVRYCVHIKDNRVQVRKYESEPDYSTQVEQTFAKFKQGAVKDYRVQFSDRPDMNHVEAQILDLVAKLYPDIFAALDAYCAKYRNYLDETVAVFDREIQFYIAYLEYVAQFRHAGLPICYPRVSDTCKAICDVDGFDLALANKLLNELGAVVCNDFDLQGAERIFVVTGPNQGGKTTFARTFGQLHYLASLGCPVAGREAQLFQFDRLFTHFEKEEDATTLRGKLADDLHRIHAILDQATPDSIIILNEIFTSTTLEDAIFLSKQILEKVSQLDALCVCITFIDELASLNEKTVSMTSTVVPDNPTVRTFKIVRRPADGLAYALSIAEKYRLTYDALKERIPK